MRRLFLDTNIILDFLGERVPFYLPSAKIMTLADQKKVELFTTSNSISTAFYILAKYENPKSALEKIRKFKLLCSISKMNDEVIEKALNTDFKDFEDAIQYFSAVETDCEMIITRNEKDFKNAKIPVLSAESYLKIFLKQ